MKKKLLLILCAFFLSQIKVLAQISFYSKYNNIENAVYRLDELYPDEINTFYSSFDDIIDRTFAFLSINAGRSQLNLINAPATIIDYSFYEMDESDSIPEAIGALGIDVNIINTTTKIIKEITLEFEFKNKGEQVYDTKTGDKYCVLKFNNLKGRSKSQDYSEIEKTIFDCHHELELKDASYRKLFFNNNATQIGLHKATIKYSDGSITNKIAIFNSYSDDETLFNSGPLKPYVEYLKLTKKALGENFSSENNQRTDSLQSHTVLDGETVHSIARQHNVSVERILRLNSFINPNSLDIQAGQIIKY